MESEYSMLVEGDSAWLSFPRPLRRELPPEAIWQLESVKPQVVYIDCRNVPNSASTALDGGLAAIAKTVPRVVLQYASPLMHERLEVLNLSEQFDFED